VAAFFLGDWDAAQPDTELGAERLRDVGSSHRTANALVGQARLYLARGRDEEAQRCFAEGLALINQSGDLQIQRLAHGLMAEHDLVRGRPEGVVERLEPLLDRSPDEQEPDATELLPWLAWAQAETGDAARARETIALAIERARRQKLRVTLADALRIQALVVMDESPEAAAALEEALEHCRAMPYPWGEEKTLYAAARLALARGDRERARTELEAARAIQRRLAEGLYDSLIARALAETAEGEREGG
jgi:tetratricopeptide (TPR) repeat protein